MGDGSFSAVNPPSIAKIRLICLASYEQAHEMSAIYGTKSIGWPVLADPGPTLVTRRGSPFIDPSRAEVDPL